MSEKIDPEKDVSYFFWCSQKKEGQEDTRYTNLWHQYWSYFIYLKASS